MIWGVIHFHQTKYLQVDRGLLVTNNKKYFDKIKVFKTQGRIGVTNGGDDIHISPVVILNFQILVQD